MAGSEKERETPGKNKAGEIYAFQPEKENKRENVVSWPRSPEGDHPWDSTPCSARVRGNEKVTYFRGGGEGGGTPETSREQMEKGGGHGVLRLMLPRSWLVKKREGRWWIRFPGRKVIYEPHQSPHRSVPGTTWAFEDSSATGTNYDARYTRSIGAVN